MGQNGVRRVAGVVSLVLAAGVLTGCVGQGQYDALYERNRFLEENNLKLQNERDAAYLERDRLAKGIGTGEGTLASLQGENAELRRQLDDALSGMRDLERRMAGLQFGPLDEETDRALADLAAQYPNLIAYDSARGMLRFATDLTFDSGSAVVKNEVRPALSALAQVLNSPAARGYEVWVEGHTDSQRISSATARNHPTNRHLSAHRAIAVIESLGQQSVNPGKMMAAGWGEYRPLVANSGNGNTPQNRRVEIYLARARGDVTGMPTVTGDSAPRSITPERIEPPTRRIDTTK